MDATAAHASLAHTQTMLDEVTADLDHFDAFLDWFSEASTRMHALEAAYRGPVQDALLAIDAAGDGTITPPVANEDAVWEASVSFHERVLKLLSTVTTELTSRPDADA